MRGHENYEITAFAASVITVPDSNTGEADGMCDAHELGIFNKHMNGLY